MSNFNKKYRRDYDNNVVEDVEEIDNPVEETVEETVTPEIVEETSKKYKVTATKLNIRTAADKTSKVVKTIDAGTIVEITDIVNNSAEWSEYGFIPSENGYINLEFAELV